VDGDDMVDLIPLVPDLGLLSAEEGGGGTER